jgi:hypothetical protein
MCQGEGWSKAILGPAWRFFKILFLLGLMKGETRFSQSRAMIPKSNEVERWSIAVAERLTLSHFRKYERTGQSYQRAVIYFKITKA